MATAQLSLDVPVTIHPQFFIGQRRHFCAWRVANVKNGKVTWRCWCGRRDEKQVRVYGPVLPAQYVKRYR